MSDVGPIVGPGKRQRQESYNFKAFGLDNGAVEKTRFSILNYNHLK